MRVKTKDLSGEALDWAVAECEGYFDREMASICNGVASVYYFEHWIPTSDWAQGGAIIEREGISLECDEFARWHANGGWSSDTPLLAAMRCYVANKLGDEVDVPDEVKEVTRLEKIKALTENHLVFAVAHWDTDNCNPNDAIDFYANGGFTKYTDEKINEMYRELMGKRKTKEKDHEHK